MRSGLAQVYLTSNKMARRADQKNDLKRKKRHRGQKLSTGQGETSGTQLSPERRRWKTWVFVISGIFFLTGVLIFVLPMATMASMVPGTHLRITIDSGEL